MSIGLFVEGKSDKDTIPKLIRKFLDTPPRIIPRTIHRGEMLKSEKVKPYLEALLKQHQDVEKVIVCVDSECTDPEEIWEEVSKVERELSRMGLPVVPRYVVVVHALEGWLAADPEAVRQVLGRGAEVRIDQNLEEICRPAELLEDIFAQHGKSFQKTRHDPQIARHADPAEIARHSSSFRRFCQLVKDA
ncbi:MAG: DUF4276 family protein [Anaerolineae bacterium]